MHLELLAPARNKEIGIAAIDCGADAVYIGGPDFGNRKDAANEIRDIAELCQYAHRFGVRIYLTVNTILRDGEEERLHTGMLAAQQAGVDAFIIRDERICSWQDIHRPLHASTQCAIRSVERARYFEALGCARIILERELSLEQVRAICQSVSCEVECFVHGSLCVCYSGDCRLSEWLDGRSADRGECIQCCRSRYDLCDEAGRILVRDKALLSLKDLNLRNRLEDLAMAGVCSFKIEGRLKNAAYVKNVVRDYALALDELCARHPDRYARASRGRIASGFTPDTDKTFNRGYTDLFIDGRRGRWSSMDTPKSMGEIIGTVLSVKAQDRQNAIIRIKLAHNGLRLTNGDGFAFVGRSGITGFRGDLCAGDTIRCKMPEGLKAGTPLYRNIDAAFEKELEGICHREIDVSLSITVSGHFTLTLQARSADGRICERSFHTPAEAAENRERAAAMLHSQLSKRSGIYSFHVTEMPATGDLPLLSASVINGIRRQLAQDLEAQPYIWEERQIPDHLPAFLPKEEDRRELMRSKYCVRYELGLCPRQTKAGKAGPLYLLNNGKRLKLGFDCRRCEMTVTAAQM